LHRVIERFTLNAEQARAFRIVARHLHHRDSPQLLMYLGGMGGTGKSRVLLALVGFLEDREESHRFIILGPTGSSAALIGGSTYHSVLGFKPGAESDGPITTDLLKIRGRLERVDLVFIDEASMISTMDKFRMHKKLAQA
ncbi:hypothetical protein FKP32DRAFT_1529723, partial [Trametes sanguinea]